MEIEGYTFGIPNDNHWYPQSSLDQSRDRQTDIKSLLNKIELLQNETNEYDEILKMKKVYLEPLIYR